MNEYLRDLIRKDQRARAEERLAELVREGLESPVEAEGTAFWGRRRENLRRMIASIRS